MQLSGTSGHHDDYCVMVKVAWLCLRWSSSCTWCLGRPDILCGRSLTKAGAAHTGMRSDLHKFPHCLNGLCCLCCQLPGGGQNETLRPAEHAYCQKRPSEPHLQRVQASSSTISGFAVYSHTVGVHTACWRLLRLTQRSGSLEAAAGRLRSLRSSQFQTVLGRSRPCPGQ